jgi:hypothetical protein
VSPTSSSSVSYTPCSIRRILYSFPSATCQGCGRSARKVWETDIPHGHTRGSRSSGALARHRKRASLLHMFSLLPSPTVVSTQENALYTDRVVNKAIYSLFTRTGWPSEV